MQKKILKLCVFVTIFLFINFPSISAYATDKELDISTSPHKVLFDIKNSKPGDSFTKVLNVRNDGLHDFNYLFSNKIISGSEKLFNELFLTVSDKKEELFKGRLKDFQKLDPRFLKAGNSENLTICVYFPYELGNEFQNLNSEFEFKFYVEGTLGGILPANGPKLPSTASNSFNILAIGSLLALGGGAIYGVNKKKKTDMKK